MEPKATKIPISVPHDIPRELVTEYLERCRSGLPLIEDAACQDRHEQARVLGHRMKGTGAPYGFSRLTEIGALIEHAAADRNGAALREHVAELAEYLGRVEILGE